MTKIVILTGAGISAESGIATFRASDGLWAQHRVEDVATPDAFARDPALVQGFYNMRRTDAAQAEPNAAHHALKRLADHVDLTLITQNVDGLHAKAGSHAIEMHGALRRGLCSQCGARWEQSGDMATPHPCPACTAPAGRPDIVWFGEIPYHMDDCMAAIQQADLFASIGTSAQVYPAAGFSNLAQDAGADLWEFNLDQTGAHFDHFVCGPATQTVPQWVDGIITSL